MAAEILVVGGTKLQKKLIRESGEYYLTRLAGYQVASQLTVVVKIRKNLFEEENAKADCIWDDDEHREFEVRIDSSMTTVAMLRCLAHECVHIWQYVSGKMRDTDSISIIKWNGKKIDRRHTDYFDLPWELEAYSREVGLLERFMNYKGYFKKKWYVDPDFATS